MNIYFDDDNTAILSTSYEEVKDIKEKLSQLQAGESFSWALKEKAINPFHQHPLKQMVITAVDEHQKRISVSVCLETSTLTFVSDKQGLQCLGSFFCWADDGTHCHVDYFEEMVSEILHPTNISLIFQGASETVQPSEKKA